MTTKYAIFLLAEIGISRILFEHIVVSLKTRIQISYSARWAFPFSWMLFQHCSKVILYLQTVTLRKKNAGSKHGFPMNKSEQGSHSEPCERWWADVSKAWDMVDRLFCPLFISVSVTSMLLKHSRAVPTTIKRPNEQFQSKLIMWFVARQPKVSSGDTHISFSTENR